MVLKGLQLALFEPGEFDEVATDNTEIILGQNCRDEMFGNFLGGDDSVVEIGSHQDGENVVMILQLKIGREEFTFELDFGVGVEEANHLRGEWIRPGMLEDTGIDVADSTAAIRIGDFSFLDLPQRG